jgi:hypothetical protein
MVVDRLYWKRCRRGRQAFSTEQPSRATTNAEVRRGEASCRDWVLAYAASLLLLPSAPFFHLCGSAFAFCLPLPDRVESPELAQEHSVAEEKPNVIYDATPVWARMVAWTLLGIGGIVLAPIALIRGDHWLFYFAVPLIAMGLMLLAMRLRIAAVPSASVLRVTNSFLGLRVRQRQYLSSQITALDLHRVAGDERERDSDTWYLRLHVARRGYVVGKYDTRVSALLARRDIEEALDTLPLAPADGVEAVAVAEPSEERRQDAARDHYKTGITLFRAGDKEGARAAFEKARAFAREPLLRRMIQQRLEELERH